MTAIQVFVVEKFVMDSSMKPFHAGQTNRICSPIRLTPRAGIDERAEAQVNTDCLARRGFGGKEHFSAVVRPWLPC